MENARRKRPPQDLACMKDALLVTRGQRGILRETREEGRKKWSTYPFVSGFAQRSPRMANKAHVMQANADLTHDLTQNL